MDKYTAKQLPDGSRVMATYDAIVGPRTIYGTLRYIDGKRVERIIQWDDGVSVVVNIRNFGRVERA